MGGEWQVSNRKVIHLIPLHWFLETHLVTINIENDFIASFKAFEETNEMGQAQKDTNLATLNGSEWKPFRGEIKSNKGLPRRKNNIKHRNCWRSWIRWKRSMEKQTKQKQMLFVRTCHRSCNILAGSGRDKIPFSFTLLFPKFPCLRCLRFPPTFRRGCR